jgi:DNA polymerase elongation subunit (family B)
MQAVIGELARAEIARQQVTSMKVERLKELKDYVGDMSINTSAEFNIQLDILSLIDAEISRQQTTSEATQKAIEWQQSLKQHHQREWEKTDVDWQMEPGAQEQHNEMMASFDMAIQSLQQYAPKEPCIYCDGSHPFDNFEAGFYGSDSDWWPGNYCPNCGRILKAGE